MRAVTIKALEKFWSITQMPMYEDNKTIVDRSIAYIGHILTKRETLVQSGEQTFELSKNAEFKLYLQNPQEALSKAYRLKPNDISVLNRYCRSLWNRSVAMKNWNDMDQQLEYMEEANMILSASINVDSDRNWFAYTTRMQVRLDIADTVIQHNQERATNSLENAKKMVIFALSKKIPDEI
jgi:hypothetical protein